MSLESSRQECEALKKDFILSIAEKEQCLFTQKREHETDKDELKKSAEEKDQKPTNPDAAQLQKNGGEDINKGHQKGVFDMNINAKPRQ